MKKILNTGALMAMVFGLPVPAHANLIANGSFESGNFSGALVGWAGDQLQPPLPAGSNFLSGWTIGGNGSYPVSWMESPDFGFNAEDGQRWLDLTGYNDNRNFGSVSQSITTTPGETYALTFYIGSDNYRGQPVSVRATAGTTTATFTSPSTGDKVWTRETLIFTANDTSTLITFAGIAAPAPGTYIGLDDVSVNVNTLATLPEPTPWTFMLAGLVGMGGVMRMNRRKSGSAHDTA